MPEHPADDPRTATDEDPRAATELDSGVVRRRRDLPVSAEEAWSLLQDADGLSRWLADDVDVVVAPGEFGSLRDGDEERFVVVEEVEAGRRVALRWWTTPTSEPAGGDDVALIDLTLEPTDADSCRLVVTEVPLRVVAIPDIVPASWTQSATADPASGPQLSASGVSTGPQLMLTCAA